jgi:hypothetical protein
MLWLEKVEQEWGELYPVCIDEKGQRTRTSLSKLKSMLPKHTSHRKPFTANVPLQKLVPVDSGQYLAWLGVPADAAGHQVFMFHHEGKRLLIPAGVLLNTLIPRLSAVGEYLLAAGSLDQLATPVIKRSKVQMHLNPKCYVYGKTPSRSIVDRFTWLACYPSARAFWGSIRDHAAAGVVGCNLPQAQLEAYVYGQETDDAVFVSRLSARTVHPTEGPFPFAVGSAPGTLNLHEFREKNSPKMTATWSSKLVAERFIVPVGTNGWSMSDNEWEQVQLQLKAEGFRSSPSAKRSLDACLVRYGEHRTWLSLPRTNAREYLGRWKSTGYWDAFQTALSAIRTPLNPAGI